MKSAALMPESSSNLEVHSLEAVHAIATWQRIVVVHHLQPPASALVKKEIAFYERHTQNKTEQFALLMVIERVFPPPAPSVQDLYRGLINKRSLGEMSIVVAGSVLGASMIRSLATGLLTISSSVRFRLWGSVDDAAARLASDFGDGADPAELIAAISALREQMVLR